MPATGQADLVTDDVVLFVSDSAQLSSDDEPTYSSRNIMERKQANNANPVVKKSTFESLPTRIDHQDFFKNCVEIMLNDAIFEGAKRQNKVLEYVNPEKLREVFDFEIRQDGSTHDELLKLMKQTIKYSVKIAHPYFVNQLFSSVDPYGLMGQWLTDVLNPSVYTYEVAPVFTLMEETVLKEMRQIVGWKNGEGDGIFCPGGSMANAYAISCARYKFMPDIKTKGLRSLPRLVLFTSEDAHYSVKKMASFLGIGTDNVYLINTDSRGKMDVDHLQSEIERSIKEEAKPFMVSATAGTTVIGAFDPLESIASLCEKYGIWIHVDAAWGGGALLSPKHKTLLNGLKRADSVTWNPHKLLTAPQQCSALLLRHRNILSNAHSANASYLFQKDKFYDTTYDVGDKHVQCGRRADVLKFWFMWKAKGTSGLAQHVEKTFENSKFFLETIRNRPGFELVIPEPECTNICFWFVPPSLRGNRSDSKYKEKLHRVAPKIKEKMMKQGTMMVTYQTYKNKPNFFRIVFQNSGLNHDDIMYLVQEFERLGNNLVV